MHGPVMGGSKSKWVEERGGWFRAGDAEDIKTVSVRVKREYEGFREEYDA